MTAATRRCDWVPVGDAMYTVYHDKEWGVPLHDDNKLYEMLVLEGMQAGLSWGTILNKREAFRKAFDGFDPRVVARYGERSVARLLADRGIVRNELKVRSAITNAVAFRKVQNGFGSFDAYIWELIGGKPKINEWHTLEQLPASTPESKKISDDLIRRGFHFVGPTIVYSLMQATGMVNDHLAHCFRYSELVGKSEKNPRHSSSG